MGGREEDGRQQMCAKKGNGGGGSTYVCVSSFSSCCVCTLGMSVSFFFSCVCGHSGRACEFVSEKVKGGGPRLIAFLCLIRRD